LQYIWLFVTLGTQGAVETLEAVETLGAAEMTGIFSIYLLYCIVSSNGLCKYTICYLLF